MAWEISHSAEAWDNARANLEAMGSERIINALADEAYHDACEADADGERAADECRARLASLPLDILVDAAMGSIRRHNTCDSGGHKFWIDRQGYHTVSVADPSEWHRAKPEIVAEITSCTEEA